MQATLTEAPVSFRHFVFSAHKNMLTIALLSMVIVFTVYKVVYPFPSFYPDSYHYIGMAVDSHFFTVWPIGYSWFLRAVHFISPSHYLLVLVHYLLLQFGSFWLAFTLFYLFQPPQWVKVTLVTFFVVNPLYLYLSNLISSDTVFAALSLCWLTILIHMLIQPKRWLLLLQGPLLAYLFIIRYQAAYYPLIMIAVLWRTQVVLGWKILSAAIAFFLLGVIVRVTIQTNQKWYGVDLFSGQAGWILADNALNMYPYVHIDTADFQNTPLLPLNRFVNRFFIARGLMQHNYTPWDGPKFMLADEVMWHHLSGILNREPDKPVFWQYNRMGVQWAAYGKYLVLHHPGAYIRYFLLPNSGVYLLPILEQLEGYNMGMNTVPNSVVQWFHMPNNQVSCLWWWGGTYLIGMFRTLFLLINAYLLIALFFMIKGKRLKALTPLQRYILFVMALSFAGNALLLISASSVMMRYQAYGIILGTMLLLLSLSIAFPNPKSEIP